MELHPKFETVSRPSEGDNLAVAVHEGEEGAFDRLVREFEAPLQNYVVRLIQNADDAQEVVQDAFIRAHRALTRQYTAEKCSELALRPWLFRIARNLAHNKRRGKRFRVETSLPVEETLEFRPAERPVSAHCRIEQKEDLERLDEAIGLLPEESRELIVLRFIEEMSYAEIASTTGQGEASLRGKVFRSIRLLREAMSINEVANAM